MQFSVPWVKSQRVWVCEAVLEAVEPWAAEGGQGNKITYGKGTGGSSRELTYNKEPICYVQVVNKTHITEVNLRVIWCAPCYQEERCHEFRHPAVLSIRDSGRPECPIRAPLFPTLALPC